MYNGKILDNNKSILDYNINHEVTLNFFIGVKGGHCCETKACKKSDSCLL